ncbi:MAG: glutamate racemase [Bdellovibrionaceae bacterium]|nr:glutamate racemase [Pseudobdellovibrionaceae bacterium]
MIGLFDSGIGGLTVLRAVRARFPNENLVYLGDTARLPYGSKSPETIERYLAQNIRFLIERGVKAVIVACNSASSVLVGRKDLRFPIPVYNVIEPGARRAIEVSKTQRIGVLGTRATVAGRAYDKAIQTIAPQAHVHSQACPLLVPLVEEGWENDPLTNLIVYRYLAPIVAQNVDTLIMGCTHYPVLRESFRRVVGPDVELVDSADAIAKLLDDDFQTGRLRGSPSHNKGTTELLVTDASPSFQEVAARLLAPISLEPLHQVDLIEEQKRHD